MILYLVFIVFSVTMEGLVYTSNLGWTLANSGPTLGHAPTMAQRRREKLTNTETSRRYRDRLRQDPQLYKMYKEKQTQLRRKSRAKQRQQQTGPDRLESSASDATCASEPMTYWASEKPNF